MGHSILVVDDQWVMRELIRDILRLDGHEVSLAGSAHDALMQARATDFDLVILDGRLPGGDGWEVLRTLRGECPDRPVIMVTGFAPEEEWRRLDAGDPAGPFDILEKPFQVVTFRETVGRALHARTEGPA